MLLCYNYQNGIIDAEEDIIFVTETKLFFIGTISLPKIIQYVKITYVGIMDTNVKTSILKQGFEINSSKKKIPGNKYESEIVLEDKVYPKTYYRHQPGNVILDETP